MSLLGWAVVGLLAGGIARRLVRVEKQGCMTTMVIGVLGAFLGGALYKGLRGDDAEVLEDFDLLSILVATLGAAALLLLLQAVGGRSSSR